MRPPKSSGPRWRSWRLVPVAPSYTTTRSRAASRKELTLTGYKRRDRPLGPLFRTWDRGGAIASPAVLSAKAVTLRRATTQLVLDRVSLSVGPRSRIGVVGPNGVGKSTLLRVLAGLESPGRGQRRAVAAVAHGRLPEPGARRPPGRDRARLPGPAHRGGRGRGRARPPDRRRWPRTRRVVDAYSEALERFLGLGGDDFEPGSGRWRRTSACRPTASTSPCRDLSGGQAARAGLAAILLARFDVFLLDEPTNDLDFAGLDRLEGFLAGSAGRGRRGLPRPGLPGPGRQPDPRDRGAPPHRRPSTRAAGASTSSAGPWPAASRPRPTRRGRPSGPGLRERIRTQRSWSETGVRKAARKPRDHDKAQQGFFTNRTEKQAAKVRQSERALARLGAMEKPWEGWELHLDLSPAGRSGDVVARLEQAVVRRGGLPARARSIWRCRWADRIAITGPNGGGKSTLLAALFGRTAARRPGRQWSGRGVVVGELDQRRARPRRRATTSWPASLRRPGCCPRRPGRRWPSSGWGPATWAGPAGGAVARASAPGPCWPP